MSLPNACFAVVTKKKVRIQIVARLSLAMSYKKRFLRFGTQSLCLHNDIFLITG